jgi:hypothetical protein
MRPCYATETWFTTAHRARALLKLHNAQRKPLGTRAFINEISAPAAINHAVALAHILSAISLFYLCMDPHRRASLLALTGHFNL